MGLVLSALIYPEAAEAGGAQDVELLKLANFWLQRRNAGYEDALLLIGVDFTSAESIRQKVAPLGLLDVELAAVSLEGDEALGEAVEPVVKAWLSTKHSGAVSFLNFETTFGVLSKLELQWWWTGVEEAPVAELSSMYDAMDEFFPAEFKPQMSTWLGLLLKAFDVGMFDSEQANYDICMHALGLARWLSGYNQVSENGFYDFSYRAAAQCLAIDKMRLGQEVWLNHAQQIADDFANQDATEFELFVACLRVCLFERNPELASRLSQSFGGDEALLFALYSAIWPDLSQSSGDAAAALLSGNCLPIGDVVRQWQFVSNGWSDFSED